MSKQKRHVARKRHRIAARKVPYSLRGTGHARLTFESLESRQLLSVGAVISEFMAVNHSTLQDADGDYSDWIEIHNPTTAPVNLERLVADRRCDDVGEMAFSGRHARRRRLSHGFRFGQESQRRRQRVAHEFPTQRRRRISRLGASRTAARSPRSSTPIPAQRADVSYGVAETNGGNAGGKRRPPRRRSSPPTTLSDKRGPAVRRSTTAGWTSGTTAVGYDTSTVPLPVALLEFQRDDGNTAADVTGNGHDGTLSNNPVWSGTSNGGLTFNGATNTVSAPIDVSENSYDRFALVQNNHDRLRRVSGRRRQPGSQRLRSAVLSDRREYGGPALERRNDRHHRLEFGRWTVASPRIHLRRHGGRATTLYRRRLAGERHQELLRFQLANFGGYRLCRRFSRTSSIKVRSTTWRSGTTRFRSRKFRRIRPGRLAPELRGNGSTTARRLTGNSMRSPARRPPTPAETVTPARSSAAVPGRPARTATV